MGIVSGRSDIGRSLVKALGLPPRTVGFTLVCDCDTAISVQAKYYTEEHQLAEVVQILSTQGWLDISAVQSPDTEATQ